MSPKKLSGAEIRQTFIDFFVEHGHTAVPSMSVVPGGDFDLAVHQLRHGAIQGCVPRHRQASV